MFSFHQYNDPTTSKIHPTLNISHNVFDYQDAKENVKQFPKTDHQYSKIDCSGLLNPLYEYSSKVLQQPIESMTDRYIPCRRQLKKIVFEKNSQIDFEQSLRSLEQTETVSDLYRRLLLTNKNSDDVQISAFQNRNKFQFSKKSDNNDGLNFQNKPLCLGKEVQSSISVKRKMNKIPYKILDAPTLQDDYYLNLIDWSSTNVLGVGLSSCVYLWNSSNSKVTKLCEQDPSQSITSVAWSKNGSLLAVGSTSGMVQIWDPQKIVKIRSFAGHDARIGAIAWNLNTFSTGSRDKTILNRDPRLPYEYYSKWTGHKQQVCGLKWSFDGQQLCSGGNDNRLLVWSPSSINPVCKFDDHKAAVKAMAWSPHQHGLLVSGGGTADRTIRFRDTLTGKCLSTVEAQSQVCNLMFSKSVNQLVSTHGYSMNQINIWKCPKMQKIATLTGHTMRVLYLSMNPEGNTIVTGAGDQTLRFWNVFPGSNDKKPHFQSSIDLTAVSLR